MRTGLIGLFLFAALGGCSSAMITTIENRGTATVELYGLCGDATYQATLLATATTRWTPVANTCLITIKGPSAERQLTIRNECRHAYSCLLEVGLPTGARTKLSGTGQLALVGDVATVGSAGPP